MQQAKLRQSIRDLTLSAMFLAIGLVLPFLTGQIPQIGSMLLPMHIPVILCGLICGWQYGGLVGAALPILRFALFGMPPLFPTGIAMTFELAAYGILAGAIYTHSRWKCIVALYSALLTAMIGGRAVWGLAMMVLCGLTGEGFTVQLFLAGAFLNAVPGILIQLLFIPTIMLALHRTGLVPRRHRHRCGMHAAKP